MAYSAPTFVDGTAPALDAEAMQELADAVELLPIANGGTGQTTIAAARNAFGLGNTTGALPIANGGTGQTTIAAARNALGLGNTSGAVPVANGGTGASTLTAKAVLLGNGTSAISSAPPASGALYATGSSATPAFGTLPVAQGGTGQTTIAAARNALGLGNTSGAVPVANGGTGQTTIAAARNAFGLGNTTGALPIANGGTGQTGFTSDTSDDEYCFYKWGPLVMLRIATNSKSSGAEWDAGVIVSTFRPFSNAWGIIPCYSSNDTSEAIPKDYASVRIGKNGSLYVATSSDKSYYLRGNVFWFTSI